MKAHKSALKHGISAEAGIYAAEHHVYIADLDDDRPAREFRLGFDPNGRLLELVVLRFDSGNELLIHAMKARSHYLDLIQ
ncbi:hypothetical protein EV641_1331 [Rhodococcus sp. SMB37]|uniref:toxin n=1 Tax=Rhodococcus sp. SMB37 TaxID=2512213 RepID=UPI00104463B2|nr:toxin [Rhodococcus sp. SMB37]TCN41218.1 hypothetical protein EV641_1331 [Rhodococcus sp. SMB37]